MDRITQAPGVYRGICVDNVDPQGLGRVRVAVPQVLGPRASGWAFPAWSFHDLTIWPEDRIPKPGQGVWVMFEHPDRMTWLAAYGEQEFTNQRYDYLLDPVTGLPAAYETSMAWDLPVMPDDIEVPIAGTLISLSGTPQPEPTIRLEKSANKTLWVPAGPPDSTVDGDGSWSFEYTRPPAEVGYWYRAVYDGSTPFWPAKTTEEQIPDPPTDTVLTVNPFTSAWQRTSTITGSLKTISGALPVKHQKVRIYQRQDEASSWSMASTVETDSTGTWTTTWYWKKEWTSGYQIRAVFLGNDTYDYSQSPIQTLPPVSVPVQVTWNFPATVALNQTFQLVGTCLASDYGPPVPASIQLQSRVPATTGTWTVIGNSPISEVGAWTLPITFSDPSADYRAYYPASSVYQAGSSPTETRTIALTTTIAAPTVPAANYGSTINITGTVRDQTGALVSGGTVRLESQEAGQAWLASSSAGTPTVTANGAYTLTHTVAFVGPINWRVTYLGGGGGYYLPSSPSAATATSVGMGTVGTPSKDAIYNTSALISWGAVSGATLYQVYVNNAWYEDSESASDRACSFAIGYANYAAKVRAGRKNKAGAWVMGAFSPTVTANGGRAAVTKSGTVGYEARPTGTATYRPSDGWGYNGDQVVQGYYSASGNNAFGVMTYDGAAFRNWITANWGADVIPNLTWNETRIAMYRIAGGTGNDITMWWHVTGSVAGSGGQPALAGGSSAGLLQPNQAGAWIYPPAHWGKHVLLNENLGGNGGVYTVNSFCLYRANSSEYGKFGGRSHAGNSCNIYCSVSWNFTSVSAVAPKWV